MRCRISKCVVAIAERAQDEKFLAESLTKKTIGSLQPVMERMKVLAINEEVLVQSLSKRTIEFLKSKNDEWEVIRTGAIAQ